MVANAGRGALGMSRVMYGESSCSGKVEVLSRCDDAYAAKFAQDEKVVIAGDDELRSRLDRALKDAVVLGVTANSGDFAGYFNLQRIAKKWLQPILHRLRVKCELAVEDSQDFTLDLGAESKTIRLHTTIQGFGGRAAKLHSGNPDPRIDDDDHLLRLSAEFAISARYSFTSRSTSSALYPL